MADESRRWVIEITGEIGESSQKEKKKTPLNTLQRIIANPSQLIKSSLLEKAEEIYKDNHEFTGTMAAVGIQAASNLVKSAKNIAEFSWNRYCTLQEDYLSQQAVSNVQTSLSKLSQAGNSILSGAASMSSFGPWGMMIGGTIGALSFGVNQYTEYQQRMSNYYQQLNSTNAQIEFSGSKLGLVNNGRGTEN